MFDDESDENDEDYADSEEDVDATVKNNSEFLEDDDMYGDSEDIEFDV